MFEREYRDLAHVPRWVIIPTIQRQSVAEHSYYVTLYASHIMFKLNLDPRFTLPALYHCLEHDRSECYTGDIPGPAKRSMVDPNKVKVFEVKGDLDRFSTDKFDADKIIVAIRKLADLMDEYAFWKEEGALGNSRCRQMLNAIEPRLDAAAKNLGELTSNELPVFDRIVIPFKQGCDRPKVVPENNTDVAS